MKRLVFTPLLVLCLAPAVAPAQMQTTQTQTEQSQTAQSPAAESPHAPAPFAGEAPPGLDLVKFGWQRVQERRDWDAPSFTAAEGGINDPRSLPSQDPGQATRLPTPVGTTTARRPREREETAHRSNATREPTPAPSDQQIRRPDTSRGADRFTYQLRMKNVGQGTVEAVEWEYLFVEKETGKELSRHRFRTFRRAAPGKSLTLSETTAAPPTRVLNAASLGKDAKPFAERVLVKCVAYADGTLRWRDAGREADCADTKVALEARRK